ncbi:hypothetical protein BJ508DRAFT_338835 [Ascobolus immersus RN42]|uniref:Uncharacterized protein n=1 Tax=Ascobolus immersus RN42 TaxID=1160509 RepID=A0A3N4IFE7_ASCIM|nr:hypothetical protein BJ508DRAFT_338835 [Ascobolus immersus RN42]
MSQIDDEQLKQIFVGNMHSYSVYSDAISSSVRIMEGLQAYDEKHVEARCLKIQSMLQKVLMHAESVLRLRYEEGLNPVLLNHFTSEFITRNFPASVIDSKCFGLTLIRRLVDLTERFPNDTHIPKAFVYAFHCFAAWTSSILGDDGSDPVIPPEDSHCFEEFRGFKEALGNIRLDIQQFPTCSIQLQFEEDFGGPHGYQGANVPPHPLPNAKTHWEIIRACDSGLPVVQLLETWIRGMARSVSPSARSDGSESEFVGGFALGEMLQNYVSVVTTFFGHYETYTPEDFQALLHHCQELGGDFIDAVANELKPLKEGTSLAPFEARMAKIGEIHVLYVALLMSHYNLYFSYHHGADSRRRERVSEGDTDGPAQLPKDDPDTLAEIHGLNLHNTAFEQLAKPFLNLLLHPDQETDDEKGYFMYLAIDSFALGYCFSLHLSQCYESPGDSKETNMGRKNAWSRQLYDFLVYFRANQGRLDPPEPDGVVNYNQAYADFHTPLVERVKREDGVMVDTVTDKTAYQRDSPKLGKLVEHELKRPGEICEGALLSLLAYRFLVETVDSRDSKGRKVSTEALISRIKTSSFLNFVMAFRGLGVPTSTT